MRARKPCLNLVHSAFELQWPNHHRNHCVVAIISDAHFHLVLKINASDEFEKAMHEMLSRLFAVCNDVNSGILLFLYPKKSRVSLRLGERLAFNFPFRPKPSRFSEPSRFWQTSRDCCFEHIDVEEHNNTMF